MITRPRSVVHLTSVHRSNDVRIFVKQCRTLAAEGINVSLIAPGADDGEIDGVRIRGVPQGANRLHRMTVTIWNVFRAALSSRASVCHFHDPELLLTALPLKLLRRKVVYDVHEGLPEAIMDKPWIHRSLRRMISAFAASIEFSSRWYVDRFVTATPHIAKRFPPQKTHVVQNFPFLKELAAPSDKPYAKRGPNIVYVGGITGPRGIGEIVKAMDLVDHPEARLSLIGLFKGNALEAACRQEPGWQKVNYFGQRSRIELAELLGAARAGLVTFHPLLNHVSAQPNKMFEYMAAGIPVIASDFPLWRQIVEDAGCGLLVDPLDSKEIATAIQWILNNPDEAEQMGERGRAAVTEVYNWERESRQLLDLYEKVS